MRWGKVITLCTAAAMLVSCDEEGAVGTAVEYLEAKISEVSSAVASALMPSTNSEYVLAVARFDSNLSHLIKDGKDKLAEDISQKLAELEHINPENYNQAELVNTPASEQLMQFHETYLIRAYYLLQALSDESFRQRIGKELELDTKDYSGEHGGVLRLGKEGKLSIEMLENTFNCYSRPAQIGHCKSDNHYSYGHLNHENTILTPFHFHAQEIDMTSAVSALSRGDFSSIELVFSRIGEKKFNADVGFHYANDGEAQRVNLDLGVYRY